MCIRKACERRCHAAELAPELCHLVRSSTRRSYESLEPDLPSDVEGSRAEAVPVLVAGYRVKPHTKIAVLAELVAVARRREPRFLEQVFGFGRGPGQPSKEPPDPVPVDFVDLVQGAPFPTAQGQNQLAVDIHTVF